LIYQRTIEDRVKELEAEYAVRPWWNKAYIQALTLWRKIRGLNHYPRNMTRWEMFWNNRRKRKAMNEIEAEELMREWN
jgi:hypothetical protein